MARDVLEGARIATTLDPLGGGVAGTAGRLPLVTRPPGGGDFPNATLARVILPAGIAPIRLRSITWSYAVSGYMAGADYVPPGDVFGQVVVAREGALMYANPFVTGDTSVGRDDPSIVRFRATVREAGRFDFDVSERDAEVTSFLLDPAVSWSVYLSAPACQPAVGVTGGLPTLTGNDRPYAVGWVAVRYDVAGVARIGEARS